MSIATVRSTTRGYRSHEPPFDDRDILSAPPPYDGAWVPSPPPRYDSDFEPPSYLPSSVFSSQPPQYTQSDELSTPNGGASPAATAPAYEPYYVPSGILLQPPAWIARRSMPAPQPLQQQQQPATVVSQPTRFEAPTHVVWSLLNTLLCPSPLAVAALYNSAKVRGARNYDEAMTYSNRAKALNCLSTLFSLVVVILVVCVYLFRFNAVPPGINTSAPTVGSTNAYGY